MPEVKTTTGESQTALATLFHCYKPVERYLRLAGASHNGNRPFAVPLAAIDAFLMQQVTTYYPVPPAVVDLAADATGGASAVFWATQPHIRQVVAPSSCSDRGDWRATFRSAMKERDLDRTPFTFADTSMDEPDGWQKIAQSLDPLSPVIFSVAVPEERAADIPACLGRLFDMDGDAVVLFLPLGPIGSKSLEAVLAFHREERRYRVAAMREIGPFFASSRLGLIYRADNASIPDVLERIRQMYEGNFQFLALAEAATAATLREKAAIAARDEAARRFQAERETSGQRQDELERHVKHLEWHVQDRERQIQELSTLLQAKDEHTVWLDTRLRSIEGKVLPWKDEYIANLETRVRNLESSKALKAGRVLRRLLKR